MTLTLFYLFLMLWLELQWLLLCFSFITIAIVWCYCIVPGCHIGGSYITLKQINEANKETWTWFLIHSCVNVVAMPEYNTSVCLIWLWLGGTVITANQVRRRRWALLPSSAPELQAQHEESASRSVNVKAAVAPGLAEFDGNEGPASLFSYWQLLAEAAARQTPCGFTQQGQNVMALQPPSKCELSNW